MPFALVLSNSAIVTGPSSVVAQIVVLPRDSGAITFVGLTVCCLILDARQGLVAAQNLQHIEYAG